MHIELSRNELTKKLELITRVSGKHATLPVLQCVLIKADAQGIQCFGTNLEMGIRTSLEGEVIEEGVVAVPSAVLQQVVTLMHDERVVVRTEGEVLRVESRGSKSDIALFASEEFPHIPELVGKRERIDGALFALGIRTVAFAVSQSTIKPELGSVYVCQKKERSLTFVATDSFRLVEKTVSQAHMTLENPLLIPQRNALEVAKILESIGSDPECVVGEGQMAFYFKEGTYMTTRLTQGSFPDYTQILPKEFVTESTILASDFQHALKMTNVFANKFLQVKMAFEADTRSLVISSESGEVGKTEERISASVEGEDLALSFNQRYLSDPLPHMPGDSIILKCAGVGRPMTMESVSENTIRYLVMPMNR